MKRWADKCPCGSHRSKGKLTLTFPNISEHSHLSDGYKKDKSLNVHVGRPPWALTVQACRVPGGYIGRGVLTGTWSSYPGRHPKPGDCPCPGVAEGEGRALGWQAGLVCLACFGKQVKNLFHSSFSRMTKSHFK